MRTINKNRIGETAHIHWCLARAFLFEPKPVAINSKRQFERKSTCTGLQGILVNSYMYK
jgi:hypothetical protein